MNRDNIKESKVQRGERSGGGGEKGCGTLRVRLEDGLKRKGRVERREKRFIGLTMNNRD